ncbi:DUF1868 domain-containing protein [Stenomitos frigidus]|uniref:DUF1868 domain-containing protein n=1 Tax=Stenomitos frigidus ULC18 TaxID=2107698 RepID=A0A2T1EGP1_9CYAN|nr:DUF1868 domain-containing protein [Stenomitos frigidus]PSB31927.1 DUF1868 domain-containing protein [Stenomitos frigidus ULC18]
MDENYQTYLNRAVRLTLPETYRSQVQHIQESPKFQLEAANKRQPAPFPGYTIVTPPGSEDAKNATLHEALTQYQQQLLQTLGASLLVPVPPESLHLTLADLIWDNAYRDASQENPEFEVQLQDQIATIFRQSQAMAEGRPLQFQALGLMIMPRAIAVCLAPTDEQSYDRVLKLRRAVFQNSDLIGLGIEQQYYFTPHITLGYFGTIPAPEVLVELGDSFMQLNQQWLDLEAKEFWVNRAELRKFDDMTHYYRKPDWATFEF